MALKYEPSKYAYFTDPDSLTEQEHKNDCDVNVIIKKASNGQLVSGNVRTPHYGYDDVNLDGLKYRIMKQQTQEELDELIETQEFDEETVKELTKTLPAELAKRLKVKKNLSQSETGPVSSNQEVPSARNDSKNSNVPS